MKKVVLVLVVLLCLVVVCAPMASATEGHFGHSGHCHHHVAKMHGAQLDYWVGSSSSPYVGYQAP
ncbi:hypothetical protein [Methanoregula sp.]|jgi:ABC-type oligopeptide transport system substrate-binding subunit|uniref:hypothetical protein n=1 Tax=Methanoregula sp. TaxID=2052170 RepID=UPI003C165F33